MRSLPKWQLRVRQTGSLCDKATLTSSSTQIMRDIQSDSRKRCPWDLKQEKTVPVWFSLNMEWKCFPWTIFFSPWLRVAIISMSTAKGRIVCLNFQTSLSLAIVFAVRKIHAIEALYNWLSTQRDTFLWNNIMLSGSAFASSVTLRRKVEGLLNHQCLWARLDILAGHG